MAAIVESPSRVGAVTPTDRPMALRRIGRDAVRAAGTAAAPQG